MERKQNRLANEKSPYLLEHKNNPVDWFPWCEEAFTKAKKEDKPVFLSIGYSSCHWCHVMMRETFMDAEVAEILNKDFVSIKVDREERPDVDNVYMTFCQMYTGSGGWPLTIFLTPDKKPFYAGTYFPKNDSYNMIGFINLIKSISKLYKTERNKLETNSDNIVNLLKESNENNQSKINENILKETALKLEYSFDKNYGGFGNQPKFPMPANLLFLIRYYKYTNNPKWLKMVEFTLENMYKGGIFDHIGYGFCRYSTDNRWLVPHFEKMLYDNALLILLYAETYSATKNDLYKHICDKIIQFVIRDMLSKEGAFYCSINAESENQEGKFYLWKYSEIQSILDDNEIKICSRIFDITEQGNFEGYSIPNMLKLNLKDLNVGMMKDEIETIRKKLFEYREKRIHPSTDDKILASWNGLMIAALSYAGRIFHNQKYINLAKDCTKFIFDKMINNNERLLTSYRQGKVSQYGYIDDYAFLIYGLTELYFATFDKSYIDKAVKLNNDLIKLFWDNEASGFYMSGTDAETVLFRSKVVYDGAIPSGNSVQALNMIRLARITQNNELENSVISMFDTFADKINSNPDMYTFFDIVYMYYKNGGRDITIDGRVDSKVVKDVLNYINSSFMPFTVTVLNEKDDVKIYICKNKTCSKAIKSFEEFKLHLVN